MTGAVVNGCSFPVFSFIFADMIAVFFVEDAEDRKTRAGWYGLAFFALGVAMFLANFAQVHLFCLHSSIIYHPIEWYAMLVWYDSLDL
jgi:hypothetical protein